MVKRFSLLRFKIVFWADVSGYPLYLLRAKEAHKRMPLLSGPRFWLDGTFEVLHHVDQYLNAFDRQGVVHRRAVTAN